MLEVGVDGPPASNVSAIRGLLLSPISISADDTGCTPGGVSQADGCGVGVGVGIEVGIGVGVAVGVAVGPGVVVGVSPVVAVGRGEGVGVPF